MKLILLVCLLIPCCCAATDNWPPTYGTMGYAQETIEQNVMNIYDDGAMIWMISSDASIISNNTLTVEIMVTGNLTPIGLSDIKSAVGEAMKDINARSPDTFDVVDVTIRHVVIEEEYPQDFTLRNSWA